MSDQEPKKQIPMDDERYRIPGTNMVNFSHWARENVEQPAPKFEVGDVVVITLVREITAVGKDCDGSTLYGLDGIGFGYSESDLRIATDEEKSNY